jgi:hypothetical protein
MKKNIIAVAFICQSILLSSCELIPTPISDIQASQTEVAEFRHSAELTATVLSTDKSYLNSSSSSGNDIRYEIVGSGVTEVSLTWENDQGGTNQGDYSLPFKKIYTNFKSGDFLYISAQISQPTSGAGSISCNIYEGDTLISKGDANGFASIASCSGTAN